MNTLPATTVEATIVEAFTPADLLSRFVQFIDAKPRTVQTYNQALRRFFDFLRSRGVVQPTRGDVLAYKEHLVATLKPNTVQLYVVAVRQFFRWAAQEGLFPNIADNIKGARQDHTFKKDPLTTNQARQVLKTIDRTTVQGSRDYAMLLLMMTTGLRCIEVARANVEDFRPSGDNMVLYIQGKGKDDRSTYVKVERPVEKALREYMTAAGPLNDKQPLFVSLADKNHGQRMTTRSVSRIAKTRFVDAGLNSSRLTAHSLRHTAGTLNLLNGATLEETKDLLRHAKLDTTMIYSHHIDRAKNKSEARICRAILGGK